MYHEHIHPWENLLPTTFFLRHQRTGNPERPSQRRSLACTDWLDAGGERGLPDFSSAVKVEGKNEDICTVYIDTWLYDYIIISRYSSNQWYICNNDCINIIYIFIIYIHVKVVNREGILKQWRSFWSFSFFQCLSTKHSEKLASI